MWTCVVVVVGVATFYLLRTFLTKKALGTECVWELD